MPETAASTEIIIAVSTVFIVVAILLMFLGVKSALEDNRHIQKRLNAQPDRKDIGSILRDTNKLEALGAQLSLPGEAETSKIKAQLAAAGYYGSGAVKIYYAVRLMSLILPQFVLLLFWGSLTAKFTANTSILISCAVMVLGLMTPPFFIRRRQNKRKLEIKNGFPDMMDLLVACVEAGLSLNAAFIRVGDELGRRYPALKINLDFLNMELRAGREQHKGIMNFAERVRLPEAKAMAVMLRQSEEMGSSMGAALRTFSEEMRLKRMMTAEEKAMALPAKLTVPLILFIFPAILVMLLLPAGVRIAEGIMG